MFKRLLSPSAVAAALFAVAPAWAQSAGPIDSASVGDSLTSIFGSAAAFSVTISISVKDAAGKNDMASVMPSAYLNGQGRSEIALARITGSAAGDAGGMQQLAAFGIDKLVIVYQPQKKATLMLFPSIKAYCEQTAAPVAHGGAKSTEEQVKIITIGKETVDGHPCLKKQLKRTHAPAGEEVFFWSATDLKDMPVKVTFKSTDGVATMLFSKYNFQKPDAALFALPPGFKKYASMQDLMMGAMQSLMPAMPAK